ncbi:MAG TPA: tRNA (guanosine(46)-N7)-methyltransferase TrmB [Burkholderiales bacterium]|nr:tRNA (guanosine(46)-N7)-methyltransferase TrmB [Burkholderiales bacterium]
MNKPVRSYVLRQGRTTPAQTRALDELFPQYGIPFAHERIDAQRLFGRCAPLVLEIGSGMGETTAAIAAQHPELDFVAIEVHGPGVGSLLKRIREAGLQNLRIVRHDAVEVLEHMVGDSTLAAVHLFFPDPWPKKRHHKRRLVQPSFARLLAAKLEPGGVLHAATDWPDYAQHIDAVFAGNALYERASAGLVARPVTKFENRGVKLGHPIAELCFRRAGSAPAAR